jgi:cytochrome c oxidase subunit 2
MFTNSPKTRDPRPKTERRSGLGWVLGLGSGVLGLGCNGTTSYLDATGTAGHQEAVLGTWLTAVAMAVVILVCIAVLVGIAHHRGEQHPPERHEIKSGLNWIYIGISATVVVLLVTFAGTMVTLNAASHPPRVPSLTMDVTGHQWWWEVRYSQAGHPELGFVTANEVHLPVGIPVRVRLHAADVIHSFWLPQIAGKTDVIPGQTNEMWLEAAKPSVSEGRCAEYCGLQHAYMTMPVVAESPDAFNKWAIARRAEAAPVPANLAAGQMIFTRTCGACHAVEGTMALGRVGPDLTHIASRPFIGAGILENDPMNLARWIRNAPSVKEGARMPAISLDSTQLVAVVAYLQSLR